MNDDRSDDRSDAGAAPARRGDDREARLAAALKANLRRRKAQARSRRERGDDGGGAEGTR